MYRALRFRLGRSGAKEAREERRRTLGFLDEIILLDSTTTLSVSLKTSLLETLYPELADTEAIVAGFLRALERMSYEARVYLVSVHLLVLLPHHESADSEVLQLLDELVHFLKSTHKMPPRAVIIARSSSDGYTSPTRVDWIQDIVLTAISTKLLPHWDRLRGQGVTESIMYDLCEDAENKCAALLLRSSGSVEAMARKRKLLEDCGVFFTQELQ
jgi:hypothetical protein